MIVNGGLMADLITAFHNVFLPTTINTPMRQDRTVDAEVMPGNSLHIAICFLLGFMIRQYEVENRIHKLKSD